MITNDIRRARIKYEISRLDNLNWFLEDFIQEFKDTISNPEELPDEMLQDNFSVIEEVKKKLKLRYLELLRKTEREQLEFKFYEG